MLNRFNSVLLFLLLLMTPLSAPAVFHEIGNRVVHNSTGLVGTVRGYALREDGQPGFFENIHFDNENGLTAVDPNNLSPEIAPGVRVGALVHI